MRLSPRFASAVGLLVVVGVASPAHATTVPTAPPGYHRVFSSPIPIPPSQLDHGGQVTCPTGTVPWGGGAGFTGGIAGSGENINTSAPTADGWRARYNNSSTRPNDAFAVEAICARKPLGYTVAFATVDNPRLSKSAATVTCPTDTSLLGGGSLSTGDTVDLQLLSAWPLGAHRYRAVIWNGSGTDQRLTAFAICGHRPPSYTIISQSGTDQGGPVTQVGGAQCPAGTKIISGGVHVTSPRPLVTLGASFSDSGDQWLSEAVNLDPNPATVTIVAICAA